jgi:hypothetical protein
MRKKVTIAFITCFVLLIAASSASSSGGSGQIKFGYTILDEEGNQAVNHSTFNLYEGPGLSLERFRYLFGNGIRLRADLKRITLNNRNLDFGFEKSGLFGVRLLNNQYRRIYDFDGNSYTRRHRTGVSLWFIPHRYVKFFGGGRYVGKSGKMVNLFDPAGAAPAVNVDYTQMDYNVGMRIKYQGRMFQVEYRAADYSDDSRPDRDRSRFKFRMITRLWMPEYEEIVLIGGYRRFETRYDATDFMISSNRVHGGVMLDLPRDFTLNYNFIFDRTGSDSDLVASDNIAHTFYASHVWPGLAQITIGYQHDINDDFYDEVRSNSYYFSGWLKVSDNLEFRGVRGFRSESMEDGTRLVGDEERGRHKLSVKVTDDRYGSLTLKHEGKNRKNDQLGSEADFNRFAADGILGLRDYGELSFGYSYSTGDYCNAVQEYKFNNHLVYGDFTAREYRNITLGLGGLYYRSKRDLDVEEFTVRFEGAYRFVTDYTLKVTYNVHNFDDFLVRDQYYTANIVEMSITRAILF